MLISQTARANLALSLAAFFWGTTFIAQREAMDFLKPMAYGGSRFTLGALCLLPLALARGRKLLSSPAADPGRLIRSWLTGAFISGLFVFVGISFQQYGLLWTTAGKGGFITCLYVILVPISLRCLGHKIVAGEAMGAVLALAGLYFLSLTAGDLSLSKGDGLVLIGAFIWAGHVLALGWLSPRTDSLMLGFGQALVCGLLALLSTVILGQWPTWGDLAASWLLILWGGVLSVALGFTLQVIGQKHARPAPAAIIMQMESVVAAIAGWLYLEEVITGRMFLGMALMLAGMLISQLWPILTRK
ncbi:MAG: DMT family transporter [Candidatus Adiutrix sp.]|jgi:drug/metabolite transporter (DMT)-like permease|nr:DMT family transporter [Candidatus Adiutrix sp.]